MKRQVRCLDEDETELKCFLPLPVASTLRVSWPEPQEAFNCTVHSQLEIKQVTLTQTGLTVAERP